MAEDSLATAKARLSIIAVKARNSGQDRIGVDPADIEILVRAHSDDDRRATRFEEAWKELHGHLKWIAGNRNLNGYLGRNIAAIATDLIRRAYPDIGVPGEQLDVNRVPVPTAELNRDALRSNLLRELNGSYDCTRVWSAWSHGTMTEDDFEPVSERIDEIVSGIVGPPAEEGEPDEPDTYAPNPDDPFARHEATHAARIAANLFQSEVADHFAVEAVPDLKAAAERAVEAMEDFYQLAAKVSVEATEARSDD